MLLRQSKPYSLPIDNKMSIVNEAFFIPTILLLWAIHELGNTWLSYEVLPWVVISLVGAVNVLNLVVMTIIMIEAVKKAKKRKREESKVHQ